MEELSIREQIMIGLISKLTNQSQETVISLIEEAEQEWEFKCESKIEKLFSASTTADEMGITTNAVHQMIRKGDLKYIQFENKPKRIPESEILAYYKRKALEVPKLKMTHTIIRRID